MMVIVLFSTYCMNKLLETAGDEPTNCHRHAKEKGKLGYRKPAEASFFHMLLSLSSLPILKVGIILVFYIRVPSH